MTAVNSFQRRWFWILLGGVSVVLALVVIGRIVREVARTQPAVAAMARLVDAANAGDLNAARRECSAAFLRERPLRLAPEGGIVGLPRTIHPNFRAWSEGAEVWLCPSNRQGPVYRFVAEGGSVRFGGTVGVLRGWAVEPVEYDEEIGGSQAEPVSEKP